MTTAAVNSNTTSPANGTASLQELVLAKKAELEAQLKALDTLDIDNLLRERAETAAHLADLDARIAQVRAQVGVGETPDQRRRVSRPGGSGGGDAMRSRLSSHEVRGRVIKAISEEKFGLSQLQIAERTGIAYGTVAAYLKANAANFRTTGRLKGKRYFLK